MIFALLVVAVVISGCGSRPDARKEGKRVLVLGFDGMDPKLLARFNEQESFPNIEKLLRVNEVRTLRTSMPPQSPVAWSNFITGMNPGGHSIYDFIVRDPSGYSLSLSTSRSIPAEKKINIAEWSIPVSKSRFELLRKGRAFWEILEENDVPATIFRIPSNFPPVQSGRSISGMGTPDLLGGYGSFTYCTDTPPENMDEITGGDIPIVSATDGHFVCKVEGPPNTFVKGVPDTSATIDVWVDSENHSAKIRVSDKTFLLNEGEWSPWVRLDFPFIGRLAKASGIVLLYLKEVHPGFKLYISPVNIDPENPAMPISYPADYSKELYEKVGYYYTQGMPEDTKALDHGLLSDSEFMIQAHEMDRKVEDIFDYELERFTNGFMFYYFSDTDLRTHMFWSALDPSHPEYGKRSEVARKVVLDTYRNMDRILGKAMEALKEGDTLIVVSDHGFASFARSFHLNSWLKDNGYITLLDDFNQGQYEFFENVDWTRTMAYAVGFNGLYINEAGREGNGIVAPGPEKRKLMEELRAKLTAVVDPETGQKVVSNLYFADEIYDGNYIGSASDMIVGYNNGYRASWESALGKMPRKWFDYNTQKWSGDHCVDYIHVPGIILSNRKIAIENPALTDMAPTILNEFGIEKGDGMIGRKIFTE